MEFYSDMTLSDYNGMAVQGEVAFPPAYHRQKNRRLTRRTFLALGSIVLGASGLGAGYAASHLSALHDREMTAPGRAERRQEASTTRAPSMLPTRAELDLAFTRHQQTVRSVTWSPDGRALASGADDHSLFIWESDGTVQTSLQQGGSVRVVAWSPDGKQLASAAANQIRFLTPLTGMTLASFKLHATTRVTSLAWSPLQPSQVVSGASDNRAIVWDARAYRTQTVFTRHTAPIEAAAWASDGQTIATSSLGGVVRVWSAASGAELHGLYLDGQAPKRALAFAPSGDELAAGGDDSHVRLWHGSTCQQQGRGFFGTQCQDPPRYLRGHTRSIRTLSWAPGGLLASAGDDGALKVWSPLRSDAPLLTIPHPAPVVASSWSPDGKRLATASENTVRIWRLS
jgi:WD40 repeat protein